MVMCSRCGRAFPTTLQVDRVTLEALVLTKVYECPLCEDVTTYVGADHVYRYR